MITTAPRAVGHTDLQATRYIVGVLKTLSSPEVDQVTKPNRGRRFYHILLPFVQGPIRVELMSTYSLFFA